VWSKVRSKELGRLTQWFGETKGTDTMRFVDLQDIGIIPRNRVITYTISVVDYRANKKINRVTITLGGNLLKTLYSGELTKQTSDLATSK
jgi:hypothetical protein